jgi:hypothetical protein
LKESYDVPGKKRNVNKTMIFFFQECFSQGPRSI